MEFSAFQILFLLFFWPNENKFETADRLNRYDVNAIKGAKKQKKKKLEGWQLDTSLFIS